MRPLATWAVVGALVVLGLFALGDALHGKGAAPAARTVATAGGRPQFPPGFAGPPRIVSRARLAGVLSALGAGGVLYLTDANCRRFLLSLPDLEWTTPQGLPGPDCTTGARPVVDERFGVSASQVAADIVEARSGDWRLRFEGNDPAFTPEGTPTFLRAGRLFEWTVQCPPGVQTISFRGVHPLDRCARPVPGAPDRLREVVWLNDHDFAAVAGQEYAPVLLVVRSGRARTLFQALGSRMGALEAAPTGRYVALRIDENLAVFDTKSAKPMLLPVGAEQKTRAIAWSPDGRYAVIASERELHVYPAPQPWKGVTIALTAVDVDWR
jgi:WD40-like Beta Propeller Repeat